MSERPTGSPGSDVYTVLVICATVVLAAGTIYLAWVRNEAFGSWMPLAGA